MSASFNPTSSLHRLLLVEDDPIAERIARAILEEQKVDLSVVSKGRDALELALSEDFDLVLMDIGLPDIDGYSLAKMIRDFKGERPYIVGLSAHMDQGHTQRCYESGMNQVIMKPLSTERVLNLLGTLLS